MASGGPRRSIRGGRLRSYVAGLRPVVRSAAGAAARPCACSRTAKVCGKLLGGEQHLWTFAAVEGAEPHNNAAERALRHAVIWRKTSDGTDERAGQPVRGADATVAATCRQRGLDVLDYLCRCLEAHLAGRRPPGLVSPAPGGAVG